MNAFIKAVEVRWSDLDPNFHLRHSVYYDYGAYCRVCFLEEHGITSMFMAKNHIGPILFREEAIFRKEVRLSDKITIDLQLLRARADHARWIIQHNIYRNEDTIAAIVTVEGAWIDTIQRKLTIPFESASAVFEKMPKAENFEWIKK
jgi:acyl-CoA thioester hydrolase